MIDTHVHLDFKEFDPDRKETIRRFFDAGGERLINVGCDLASSERSVELAGKHENIFASIGVHPHDAESLNEDMLKRLEELVTKEKVIAVGEIGLDFFRNLSPREKQVEAFRAQLELAENHQKPVIIHCREAYIDLIKVLKDYKTENWRGAVHCFLGSWEIAEQLLGSGFYLGFTGAITYAKPSKIMPEPEIFKVIKNTPSDRILIETDCPYLAPVPMRGKRNEPAFVKYIAEKIAGLKGVNVEVMKKAASENAGKLFGF